MKKEIVYPIRINRYLALRHISTRREADEIIDWIAAQSWSDGGVGMFGDSIQAQMQYRAASMGNAVRMVKPGEFGFRGT